jgi:hypothetical protein
VEALRQGRVFFVSIFSQHTTATMNIAMWHCTRHNSSKTLLNISTAISSQRRHFVRPRAKIRDPLAAAPSTELSYPSLTETQGISEDAESQKKLTFIHRPPPTSPSPHSMITAPASPLLRKPTSHSKTYQGIVKLYPSRAPVITMDGNPALHGTPVSGSSLSQQAGDEPPLLRNYPHARSRHLTEEKLTQMRELRAKNPELYTRSRLAKMFNCSPVFVSMAAPLPKDALKRVWREQAEQKQGWTWRKQLAREMREKRRALW